MGFKTYKCSCLSYPDYATKLITIVVATVGSSLILFIFIIVTSLVIRRSKKRKGNSLHQAVDDSTSEGNRGITIDSQQPNNTSPASDESISKFYQTDIYDGRNTGEEQLNMNVFWRVPSNHLISSARGSVYKKDYQNINESD